MFPCMMTDVPHHDASKHGERKQWETREEIALGKEIVSVLSQHKESLDDCSDQHCHDDEGNVECK